MARCRQMSSHSPTVAPARTGPRRLPTGRVSPAGDALRGGCQERQNCRKLPAAGTTSVCHHAPSAMRRTTATVAPWPAHPTIGQRGACFRGQYGSQLPHPETGHLVEQVRPHPAGPQTLQCPGFVVDERRQPPPDRPTMPGLVLGSRTMIAMSTAQQRPPRRKLVLPQPQPGLPRARDRPGRQNTTTNPRPATASTTSRPGSMTATCPRCSKNRCHACRRFPPESPTVKW